MLPRLIQDICSVTEKGGGGNRANFGISISL